MILTWAGSKLVLVCPEAVSGGDDMLLGDENPAAVWEDSASWGNHG